jgi:hypothetical protein
LHEELRNQKLHGAKALRMHHLDCSSRIANVLGLLQSGPLRVPVDIRQDLLFTHPGTAGLPHSGAGHGLDDLHEHGGRDVWTTLRFGHGPLVFNRDPGCSFGPEGGLLRLHQWPLAVRERCRMADVAAQMI